MAENNNILGDLREGMKKKGLTCQMVAQLTEEAGEAVSESTIRRMMRPGARAEDFRWETSILPVSRVVLEPVAAPDAAAAESYSTDALEAVITAKDEHLAAKEAELQRVVESERERVDYMRRRIEKLERTLFRYRAAFFILLGAVIFVLILDAAMGHVGWFRY